MAAMLPIYSMFVYFCNARLHTKFGVITIENQIDMCVKFQVNRTHDVGGWPFKMFVFGINYSATTRTIGVIFLEKHWHIIIIIIIIGTSFMSLACKTKLVCSVHVNVKQRSTIYTVWLLCGYLTDVKSEAWFYL